MFPHRRRQHRPVSVNEPVDSWTFGSEGSQDGAAASSSSTRTTAVKIMHTVRRISYSAPKKRDRGQPEGGMYSTPAETSPPTPSAYSFHDRPDTRPTIEQIAMGLHISRTPHALPHRATTHPLLSGRRSGDSARAASHSHLLTRPSAQTRRASMSAIALPPPPVRSSLKKSSRPPTAESSLLTTSASDASLSTMTTLTSNAPSTPRSVQSAPATSFPGKLRMEMLRLLPMRKGSLSSSVRSDSLSVLMPSDDDSTTSEVIPRKMVRFSTGPGPQDVPPGAT